MFEEAQKCAELQHLLQASGWVGVEMFARKEALIRSNFMSAYGRWLFRGEWVLGKSNCVQKKWVMRRKSLCDTVGVCISSGLESKRVTVALEVCLLVWQGSCDCV